MIVYTSVATVLSIAVIALVIEMVIVGILLGGLLRDARWLIERVDRAWERLGALDDSVGALRLDRDAYIGAWVAMREKLTGPLGARRAKRS